MDLDRFIDYHLERQCADQWRPFLASFAAVLGSQIPREDLRGLMREIGVGMAQGWAVPQCDSLQELETRLNEVWERLHWGWVELRELEDYVRVRHFSSPLITAFGPEAVQWAPALLEGVYGWIFETLGAGEEFAVTQHGEVSPRGEAIEFRLQSRTETD
jgi:hypothetical protein